MGIVLKRAQYFITCNGKYFIADNLFKKSFIEKNLVLDSIETKNNNPNQLSLFHE